jgi:hypothetical protein
VNWQIKWDGFTRTFIVYEMSISLSRAITKLKVESNSVLSAMFGVTVAMCFTSMITSKWQMAFECC